MNKQEVWQLLNDMKGGYNNFFIDPSKAVSSWHYVLGDYEAESVRQAVLELSGAMDTPPTANQIRAHVRRVNAQKKQQEEAARMSYRERCVEKKFEPIPGRDRLVKIVWVCADQSAKHWRAGSRNEHFAGCLLKAKAIYDSTGNDSFMFEGINYEEIKLDADQMDGLLDGLMAQL